MDFSIANNKKGFEPRYRSSFKFKNKLGGVKNLKDKKKVFIKPVIQLILDSKGGKDLAESIYLHNYDIKKYSGSDKSKSDSNKESKSLNSKESSGSNQNVIITPSSGTGSSNNYMDLADNKIEKSTDSPTQTQTQSQNIQTSQSCSMFNTLSDNKIQLDLFLHVKFKLIYVFRKLLKVK